MNTTVFPPIIVWSPERIRLLRLFIGMTRRDFADELGVDRETVTKWEMNTSKPNKVANRLLTVVAEHAHFT